MNKVNRSTRLLKTAFAILLHEKKLFLFPVIATGLTLVIALFYFAPVALCPTGHSYFSAAHWSVISERISQTFSPPLPSNSPRRAMVMEISSSLAGGSQVIFQHWWMTLSFAITYFISMLDSAWKVK